MEEAGVLVFDYFDYRKFLHDYYEWKRARHSFFSYRYICRRIGMDHGSFIKVLQGQRHLPLKVVQQAAEVFDLRKRKAEYFELLVLYGRAKSERETKRYFEQLISFKELGVKKVEAHQYEFYQKWYYTAVRELVGIGEFGDNYEMLASVLDPPIKKSEAQKAIQLLKSLGFIRKNDKGIYELVSRYISTGDAWGSVAVRTFQRDTLRQAVDAISAFKRQERDISTVTLTLNDNGIEMAKEKVGQFHRELLEISNMCGKADRVYQINIQLFPMSKRIEGKR
jgi:uncharacterized protein (TIGR02147 family)